MPDREKPVLLVLVHGIRTHATWYEKMGEWLDEDERLMVKAIGYGRFDAFRFWFPFFTRTFPVRTVEKKLGNILIQHPYSEWDIVILAHSFGTYAVSKVLPQNPGWKISDIILCGSIVSSKFDWMHVFNQLTEGGNILNECGRKDVWPVAAKSLCWGYGNAGTYGVQDGVVKNRAYPIGHSDFLTQSFVKEYWEPFVRRREIINSEITDEQNEPPSWFRIFDLPLKTLIIVVILLAIFSTPLASRLLGFSPAHITYLWKNCNKLAGKEYDACARFQTLFQY